MDNHILHGLSRFQKILLVTDGTVTNLLEHHLEESITVVKLNEKTGRYDGAKDKSLQHTSVLEREILLQGKSTKVNWLYAKSTIFLDYLREDFLVDLMESNEPIGKLWAKHKLETYKCILSTSREKAETLAKYFDIGLNDELVSRTYSVYSNRKVIMIITEKFPIDYFRDEV